VETALIFVIAASGMAAVVWWASMPPDGTARKSRPRLRFQETFQTTGPEPAPERGDGFVLMSEGPAVSVTPDEHPNPVLSVIRLVLTIAIVSLVGVAVLGGLGYFVYRLIDGYFAGSVS
jgi:nitrate reductase NapE component